MITIDTPRREDSTRSALTLDPDYLGTHLSGWTIKGEIHEDWYQWINEFEATHPEYGEVKGDFEDKIYATSQEAFDHFVVNHPPSEWDYEEI